LVNVVRSLKSILLAAVVLTAGTALAANKGSLQLQHPTSIAGKQLATGDYTLQWNGSGDQVELKVMKGKNVVASTPARVVKVDAPRYDSVLTNSNSDGTSSLSQIRFRGKTFALEIAGEGGGSGAAGASR
jgi:hypothetical protein